MQVHSRETSAETLIKTLRELPNKEALALRSEVAMQVGCCRKISSLHVGFWDSSNPWHPAPPIASS